MHSISMYIYSMSIYYVSIHLIGILFGFYMLESRDVILLLLLTNIIVAI